MNRVCRKIDLEYADCTRCGKTLTLRALAYNHAKTCKPYDDRVKKRTAEAYENYERRLKMLRCDGVYEGKSEDNAKTSTTATTDSEHGAENITESASHNHNSEFSNTSAGITNLASIRRTSGQNTHDGQSGITALDNIHDKALGAPFEVTSSSENAENTYEGQCQATYPFKINEKTADVTNECQKTSVSTNDITSQGKKTLRITPGTAMPKELDSKIAGMFHHMPRFR